MQALRVAPQDRVPRLDPSIAECNRTQAHACCHAGVRDSRSRGARSALHRWPMEALFRTADARLHSDCVSSG